MRSTDVFQNLINSILEQYDLYVKTWWQYVQNYGPQSVHKQTKKKKKSINPKAQTSHITSSNFVGLVNSNDDDDYDDFLWMLTVIENYQTQYRVIYA